VVGVADLLLDIYKEVIPPDVPDQPLPDFLEGVDLRGPEPALASPTTLPLAPPSLSRAATATSLGGIASAPTLPATLNGAPTVSTEGAGREAEPDELNRLAARDRAYFLLSTLTKLGTGWDYSEGWMGLARGLEESGQVERAKEVMWWCVELEDSRPVRGWEVLGK